MFNDYGHPSDEELVMFGDGEHPAWREGRIRAHLLTCWSCRVRLKEIEETVANFIRFYRASADSHSNSNASSRALLRLRLARLIADTKPRPLRPLWFSTAARRLAVCLIIGALLTLAWHWRTRRHGWQIDAFVKSADSSHAPIPNRRLTPGAIRLTSKNEVCGVQDANIEHPVPLSVQREVFREYGIPNAEPEDYEIDHLITPGLGGSDDMRNLWPEPHSATTWNSYVKDTLEDRLHQMVCDGRLDLGTAQHEIATDWIAAYKKYFFTDKPLVEQHPSASASAIGPDSRS